MAARDQVVNPSYAEQVGADLPPEGLMLEDRAYLGGPEGLSSKDIAGIKTPMNRPISGGGREGQEDFRYDPRSFGPFSPSGEEMEPVYTPPGEKATAAPAPRGGGTAPIGGEATFEGRGSGRTMKDYREMMGASRFWGDEAATAEMGKREDFYQLGLENIAKTAAIPNSATPFAGASYSTQRKDFDPHEVVGWAQEEMEKDWRGFEERYPEIFHQVRALEKAANQIPVEAIRGTQRTWFDPRSRAEFRTLPEALEGRPEGIWPREKAGQELYKEELGIQKAQVTAIAAREAKPLKYTTKDIINPDDALGNKISVVQREGDPNLYPAKMFLQHAPDAAALFNQRLAGGTPEDFAWLNTQIKDMGDKNKAMELLSQAKAADPKKFDAFVRWRKKQK
jgi:hypothetical protein